MTNQPAPMLQQLKIITTGFIFSTALIGALPLTGMVQPVELDIPMLGAALAGVGIVFLGLGKFLKGKLYKPIRLPDGRLDTEKTFPLYLRATIISLTLWEAAGIFGLVAFFVSGNTQYSTALCVFALLSMALNFPKEPV